MSRAIEWILLGAGSCTAIIVGLRWHRPARVMPWLLLAGAIAVLAIGDVFFAFDEMAVATGFYLAMFVLVAGALLQFTQGGSVIVDRARLIDILAFACAALLVVWVFVIGDNTFLGEVSPSDVIGSLLLIVVAARLTLAVPRNASAVLLLVGSIGLLSGDVLYPLFPGEAAETGFRVLYVTWGLAALHPSMVRLTQPMTPHTTSWHGRWAALLGASVATPPAVLLIEALQGEVNDGVPIAIAGAITLTLTITRLADSATLNSRALARERGLRGASTALVSAADVSAVDEALRNAVAALLPRDAVSRVVFAPDDRHLAAEHLPPPPPGRRRTWWVDNGDTSAVEPSTALPGASLPTTDGPGHPSADIVATKPQPTSAVDPASPEHTPAPAADATEPTHIPASAIDTTGDMQSRRSRTWLTHRLRASLRVSPAGLPAKPDKAAPSRPSRTPLLHRLRGWLRVSHAKPDETTPIHPSRTPLTDRLHGWLGTSSAAGAAKPDRSTPTRPSRTPLTHRLREWLRTSSAAGAGEQATLVCPLWLEPLAVARPSGGALVLTGRRAALSAAHDALEVLAGQAAMALDRISLVEAVGRRDSDLYLRTVISNTADLMLVLDEDQRIRYASPALHDLLGDDELSPLATLEDLVHPDDRGQIRRAFTTGGDGTMFCALRRPDHSQVLVEATYRDLRGDRLVQGFVVTMRNATEPRNALDNTPHREQLDLLPAWINRRSAQHKFRY